MWTNDFLEKSVLTVKCITNYALVAGRFVLRTLKKYATSKGNEVIHGAQYRHVLRQN